MQNLDEELGLKDKKKGTAAISETSKKGKNLEKPYGIKRSKKDNRI